MQTLRFWILGISMAMMAGGPAVAGSAPDGWTALNAAQIERLRQEAKTCANPNQTLAVSADFDGDGRKDRATFLFNNRTGGMGLFVIRAATGRYRQLMSAKREDVCNLNLGVEPTGSYEPACSRGLGDDAAPCRKTLVTRWPAIGLTHVEASWTIYFWDGRKFDRQTLSD